ncbi:hypothetical protein C0J52_14429 [Blattella germanica]|nr:hypothetical protein C0J52_14429 [Blattella germanica]
MKQIPGCEKAYETDGNKWFPADTEDQVMVDHEIVSLVSQSDEDVADTDPQITHSEAAKHWRLPCNM